jgi:hypothetical protein
MGHLVCDAHHVRGINNRSDFILDKGDGSIFKKNIKRDMRSRLHRKAGSTEKQNGNHLAEITKGSHKE